MFGVILTVIYKSCGITTQKVEGFKTKEAVETFAKNWEKPFHPEWLQYGDCHTERPYSTHYTIYEIDDAYARQETPVCTGNQPAYDAQMDMRPKDLFNKLWDLRSAVMMCKSCICDDPMQTATVIENITIADRLANELFDAFPEDTVEDEKKDKDTEAE